MARDKAVGVIQLRMAKRIARPMDPYLLELAGRIERGDFRGRGALRVDLMVELDRRAIAGCGDDLHAIAARVEARLPGFKLRSVIGSVAIGALTLPRRRPRQSLEKFRGAWDAVLRVKASPFIRLQAGAAAAGSAPASGSAAAQIGRALAGLDGKGVIVGIVDDGCDLAHPNFQVPRRAHGAAARSRVEFFWDQRGSASASSPAGYGYGRELTKAQIDAWLASGAQAEQMPLVPPGGTGHGTRVLDMAAGGGLCTQRPGVAPGASLIVVRLASEDVEQPYRLSHSTRVIEAVDYIFRRADALGMPAVVNLSLASQAGPHDGTSLFETVLDRLASRPGRAIVLAAGNDHADDIHAQALIAPRREAHFDWCIAAQDGTENRLELWYSPGSTTDRDVEIALVPPGKDDVAASSWVLPDHRQDIAVAGRVLGTVIHRARDSAAHGDGQILVTIRPCDGAATGVWRVVLRNRSSRPISCHAWLDGDDLTPFGRRTANQSRFMRHSADPGSTVSGFACGRRTIAVGAFSVASGAMAPYSGRGRTRDGRRKPDLLASGEIGPGERLLAAQSGGHAGLGSGTSMAAPQVAGLLALLLQRHLEGDKRRSLPDGRALAREAVRLCGAPGTAGAPSFPGVAAAAPVMGRRR